MLTQSVFKAEMWDAVVAIPACRESVLLPRTLNSIVQTCGSKKIAIVVVVNHTEDASGEVKMDNLKTLERLTAETKQKMDEGVFWCQWHGCDLFVIDRASQGRELPCKQGVGLARKISCDFSLCIPQKSHWIRTTDADVVLPESYWDDDVLPKTAVAWRWPYTHIRVGEPMRDRAIHLYELFLQLWEEGLRYAGSPYAWQAMGSCLGFSKEAYAMVRGYPLRQAGEDFYILNKMQKVGQIHMVYGVQPIQLESRLSDRVPFGTGAAMQNLIHDFAEGLSYQVYHPQTFIWLKEVLRLACVAIESQQVDQWDASLPAEVQCVHQKMGIQVALERCLKHGAKTRKQQFHVWFDGFRTMKWMHHVRNEILGTVDIRSYLEEDESALKDFIGLKKA